MKKLIPILLILFLYSSNCINNVEDLSEASEEPIDVSYLNDVQLIFNDYCTDCHGANGGISLTNYSNTTSGNSNNYGSSLIIAGDADASGLIDKIGPNPEHGATMPPNEFLTNDEIATIRAWINQGAKDN